MVTQNRERKKYNGEGGDHKFQTSTRFQDEWGLWQGS